jgi:exodeoxyribonuclease VII small subunit
MTGRPRKERSFEESLARLEQIVAEIESEELGLEKQFELFQEGMALARVCDRRLSEVEKSVELVLKSSEEEWKTGPFETEEEAEDVEAADEDDDRR